MGGFGSGLAWSFGVALGGASVPGVDAAVGSALVLLALQAINEMSQKKRTGPSKVADSLTWFSEAVYFGLILKIDEKWALRLNAGLVDFSGHQFANRLRALFRRVNQIVIVVIQLVRTEGEGSIDE